MKRCRLNQYGGLFVIPFVPKAGKIAAGAVENRIKREIALRAANKITDKIVPIKNKQMKRAVNKRIYRQVYKRL